MTALMEGEGSKPAGFYTVFNLRFSDSASMFKITYTDVLLIGENND